jgi:hypothetical protein
VCLIFFIKQPYSLSSLYFCFRATLSQHAFQNSLQFQDPREWGPA